MEASKPLIKVRLKEHPRKVMTVLARMGIQDQNGDLHPTAYLVKLGSDWFVTHFKFCLGLFNDDYDESLSDSEDINRLSAISHMLQKWKLVKIDEETEAPPYIKFDIMGKDEDGRIINRVNTRKLDNFNHLMEKYV